MNSSNIKISKLLFLILAIIILVVSFLFILTNEVKAQSIANNVDILNIEVENIDGKNVKIKWATNIDTTGKVIYGEKKDNLPYYIGDSNSPSRYHEVIIGGLKPKTDYYYQIIVSNNTEQVSSFIYKYRTSDFKIVQSIDISDIEFPYISGTTAFITWKTDILSNSIVEYGESGLYNRRATGNDKTTDHQVILRNLKANTTYYVRVYSVDKDRNQSNYLKNTFTTLENSGQDKLNLAISYVRPSSPTDSNITANSMVVSFKTSRYAKAVVKIYASGFKTQVHNLDWGEYHEVKITGLTPDKQYTIDVSATDVLNKRANINFTAKTKTAIVTSDSGSTSGSKSSFSSSGSSSGGQAQLANYTGNTILTTGDLKCDGNIFETTGYYGQYFLTNSDYSVSSSKTINDFDWQSSDKFKMARIDQNVVFGSKFYALGNDVDNQPIHFFAYWRAIIDVPADGSYSYSLSSDDESWIYIDGVLDSKLGSNQGKLGKKTITLKQGPHALEMYFVFRGRTGSTFSFVMDEKIKTYPWPNSCKITEVYKYKSSSTGASASQTVISGSKTDTNQSGSVVRVAGAEYSYYSQATALLKTKESPDVYAIINGQKHYISSPTAFNEYGYDWNKIKTVCTEQLAQYPDARLIKLPDQDTVYFLYQRSERKWLKITLNSPTVFVSYSANYWGNIIKVNKYDLESYPDVKLIKTKTDSSVYYLENNLRRQVSDEVFQDKGFNPAEVVEVSQIHMESYKLGEPLK